MHALDNSSVLIRSAQDTDRHDLEQLAQLDSNRYAGQPALVAEVDGQIEAAISLDGHLTIADPFEPTCELLVLLDDFRRHAGAGHNDSRRSRR